MKRNIEKYLLIDFESYINQSDLTVEKKDLILNKIKEFENSNSKPILESLKMSNGKCPTCGQTI